MSKLLYYILIVENEMKDDQKKWKIFYILWVSLVYEEVKVRELYKKQNCLWRGSVQEYNVK